ncbi:sulfatase family protein [Pontiella sulfatireligans]|uniref:Arylsulfatase n=1 Tax=Pontiella sulfatireligans TaxID=2750658 RepID=A0A6C2UQ72_9BACT|nr:sulfatase-like hydrolase/transferase [Pontiella sulfatireligans]SPS74506.1 sulfatase S1_51 [Kiritimatiellales bacterium]VGO22435.1 Arylsulfatase [Pontiella sulfatireligans]
MLFRSREVLFTVLALFALTASGGAERPNVIVFFTDDLDFDETPPGLYDLERFPSHTGMKQQGFYDDDLPKFDAPQGDFFENPTMLMPNLQQLAKDGMVLERFYITSPICTPSRYSILTGRYASRSKGFQKKYPAGKSASVDWSATLLPTESNLPKALQKAGYTTGMVGKWHNGHGAGAYNSELRNMKLSDPGVNEKVKEAQRLECETMQKEQGFDYAASLQMGNVGALKAPKELRQENLEWVTQGALDFIEQEHEKPFFLYVSLPLPHRQYYDSQARNPNAAYWFSRDARGTPGGWLDEVSDCMPPRDDVVRRCKEAGIPMVNTMGTYIDDSLGAILQTLEKQGLAENTMVIFTSDHQSRGKNTVGEAARVPFVVRWPGKVAAGSRKAGISSNVDLVSTILDVAGSKESGDVGMDGQSMLPMLTTEEAHCRDSLYLEVMHTRAVVSKRWKYIAGRAPAEIEELMAQDSIQALEQQRRRRVSWDGRINTPENVSKGVIMDGDREFPGYFDRDQLYDLDADPFEQNNLAGDPANAETLNEMKELLKGYLAGLPHPFGEF